MAITESIIHRLQNAYLDGADYMGLNPKRLDVRTEYGKNLLTLIELAQEMRQEFPPLKITEPSSNDEFFRMYASVALEYLFKGIADGVMIPRFTHNDQSPKPGYLRPGWNLEVSAGISKKKLGTVVRSNFSSNLIDEVSVNDGKIRMKSAIFAAGMQLFMLYQTFGNAEGIKKVRKSELHKTTITDFPKALEMQVYFYKMLSDISQRSVDRGKNLQGNLPYDIDGNPLE